MSEWTSAAAAVAYVLVMTGVVVVAWMVLMRKGWWHVDAADRIDWTSTDGCHLCWEYGPFEEPPGAFSREAVRDRHQAWHGLTVAALKPVVTLVGKHA